MVLQSFTTICMDGRSRWSLTTKLSPVSLVPRRGCPQLPLPDYKGGLSAYQYEIEYRSTVEHGNADVLSRLPLPGSTRDSPSETHLYNVRQLESLPLTCEGIRKATQRDPILSKVHTCMMKGWPNPVPKALQPYY
jgi:hypothetical protein